MLPTTVESTTIQNPVDVKSYLLGKCLVNSLRDTQQAEQHVSYNDMPSPTLQNSYSLGYTSTNSYEKSGQLQYSQASS